MSAQVKHNAHATVVAARPVWEAVAPSDLPRATPCALWDVQDLAEHVFGGLLLATETLSGAHELDAGQLAAVPATGFESATLLFLQAVDRVQDGEVRIHTRLGEMTRDAFVRLITADLLVHTWDLAKAIGVHFQPPLDAAHTTLDDSRSRMGPDEASREGLPFAGAVDVLADATPTDRLAAWFGRDPNWSESA
nr:TIGR03086 family protein [Actinomycetales bacterium]